MYIEVLQMPGRGVGLRELFFGLNYIAEGCAECGDCLPFHKVGELKYFDTRETFSI